MPRATRSSPSSRPASSVSKSAAGYSPSSARQGRSWLAACRIHSASPMAAPSRDRSGVAIGSISAVPTAGPAQLHEVGPLAVAVARGALGVEGDRAAAAAHPLDELVELGRADDRVGHAVDGFAQQRDVGLVLLGGLDGLGGGAPVLWISHVPGDSTVTPSGGRPAAAQSRSTKACRCGLMSASSAVQEARISSSMVVRGTGQIAEAGGRGLGDGAAGGAVARRPLVEGTGQPAPADRGQHRVDAHLRIELSGGERDQAQHAVPRLDAVGVVQQHQAPGGQLLAVADANVGGDGVAERRQPLGRSQRLDADLGTDRRARQAGHGLPEQVGCRCLRLGGRCGGRIVVHGAHLTECFESGHQFQPALRRHAGPRAGAFRG